MKRVFAAVVGALVRAFDYEPIPRHKTREGRWVEEDRPMKARRGRIRRDVRFPSRGGKVDPDTGVRRWVKYPVNGVRP